MSTATADLDQLRADSAACLATAIDYLRRGWSVLPLCNPHHVGVGKKHGAECGQAGKVPIIRWKDYQDRLPAEAEVHDWWRQNPLCNLGVALGPVSGLIRVDVDGPGGEARLRELSRGDLPPTLEFTSGRANGGRGLLFAIPPGVTLRTTADAHRRKEELRFQAKGAQTVLPPSRHSEGCRYAWSPGRGPGEVEIALAPPWLVEQLREGGGRSNGRHDRKRAPALADGELIEDGRRDSTLTSLAGSMRRRGISRDAIFAALSVENESRCDPPLDVAQVRKIADSVARYEPHESNGWHDGSGRATATATTPVFANFVEQEVRDGEKSSTIRAGLPLTELGERLAGLTGGWPKRVGRMLFAEADDDAPLWLENTDALFAWAGRVLAHDGATNPIRWAKGTDKGGRAEFFHHLGQTAENYDAVEPFPHYPPLPRTYYLHQRPAGGDGKALAALLARFRPATLADADLLRAFFLSLLWGGEPGQRPAWLFTAEDRDPQGGRGIGKSKIVQLGARLVGGHIDGSPNEPIQQLITRLLSVEGIDKRVVLLDNIKTLRFSCAEMESLITNDIISGHRMYAGEGRRPNTLTYCLTLNGASLSRDMAQRCIIVKVARPPHDGSWERGTAALIAARRWEIIGDILAELQGPGRPLPRHTRWGAWETEVLAKVPDPSECLKVIAERQGEVDEDSAEADTVREAFREELRRRGHCPEREAVWVPSRVVAGIVNTATDEKRPTNKATAYLRTLAIAELRESRRGQGRGWTWWGEQATADSPTVPLNPEGGLCPPGW